VAVGGLGPNEARAELRRQLAPVFESPVNVRFHGHRHIEVPTARLGQVMRYRDMVAAAYDQLARGAHVHVRLMRTIDGDRLSAATLAIARPFYRPVRNASVRLGIRHVRLRRAHTGRAVDVRELRRHLLAQLRKPTGSRRAWGHVRWTKPSVRRSDLRRRIPTYVSVSRAGRVVRLFKRLRVVRRYRVAVGAAGYDTPAGLHHVLSKQVNPTWYVPNRPWAGSLAGQTIGPGDPRNPLKARFISLGGGVGFHGTADLASIGQAASHGCIRMTVPDVVSLYNRVSVGTPVLIR
jgi:lipoprotein-anchoring transpeptidase ErfK/SrfK